MWLRTSVRFIFDISVETPFVFMLRPRSGAQQWVGRESYSFNPLVQPIEYTDGYGNLCQRFVAHPGTLEVSTSADILSADFMDEAPGAPFTLIQDLPEQVLGYLLPSRYCEADRFNDHTHRVVANTLPGYDQVAAVTAWVRDNIDYRPGSIDSPLSAREVTDMGYGVCRDLAHVAIAMCRSISIPARMVVGYRYNLEPMDLHAWFDAYVGGRWYTFDPTQPRLEAGYIPVAFGRDAADVAIYTQFGPTVIPRSQEVHVDRLDSM